MSTTIAISEKTANAINTHLTSQPRSLRLNMIRIGIRFEVRCPGMRMTAKAPKCSTILRREFGLKGTPIKLLAQFEELLVLVGLMEQDDTSTVLGPDGKHQLKPELQRN